MQKSHEILWKQAKESLERENVFRTWFRQLELPHWPFQNLMSGAVDADEAQVIYFALIRAIAAQQLSTKSAKAILQKLKKTENDCLPSPQKLLKMTDENLKACGLSRQKIHSLRAVAEREVQNQLPTLKEASLMESAALRQILTEIPGIGAWSADMVMLFALQHPDIFAVGDYGVREGYRLIYQLEKQPSPKALFETGKKFAPYRSFLTGYCWAVKEFTQKCYDLT